MTIWFDDGVVMMIPRLRRLAVMALTTVLLAVSTPAVSHPEAFCNRHPWWPGCHRHVAAAPAEDLVF